jgi:hypothetical protein
VEIGTYTPPNGSLIDKGDSLDSAIDPQIRPKDQLEKRDAAGTTLLYATPLVVVSTGQDMAVVGAVPERPRAISWDHVFHRDHVGPSSLGQRCCDALAVVRAG